jgi:signal peptidase I
LPSIFEVIFIKISKVKNKWLITLIVFFGVLACGWIIVRITGALQMYRIPTPSSEPTIKVGDIVFTSNLKKPQAGNFITFKSSSVSDSIYATDKKGQTYISRLIATEGQTVEMKDGVCFVNGKNFDADKTLLHEYITNNSAIQMLPDKEEMEQNGYLMKTNDSTYRIFLSSLQVTELKKKNISLEKVIYKDPIPEIRLFKWMNKDSAWAIDDFGPLKIPKGHFFVMGDNRHNSLDSRYIGFIKKENYRGTVLNK